MTQRDKGSDNITFKQKFAHHSHRHSATWSWVCQFLNPSIIPIIISRLCFCFCCLWCGHAANTPSIWDDSHFCLSVTLYFCFYWLIVSFWIRTKLNKLLSELFSQGNLKVGLGCGSRVTLLIFVYMWDQEESQKR